MVSVSVVLPLYNKAAFLRRTLDSIAVQTFSDFEVIIVNDGSIDGGEALAEAYPDSRFRTLHQANAGPGAARNRGLAEAKGSFIAFLDADDEWLPEYLERNLKFIKTYTIKVASVTSSFFEYPSGYSTVPMWRTRGLRQGLFRLSPSTPAMQFVHTLAFISPCSTVVRADVFNRWGVL
jgi:glycosyltransferase involved in cell wall biosynthesis